MIYVTHSTIASPYKPDKADMWRWQKPYNYVCELVTIDHIAELIETGHAFRAGIYGDETPNFQKKNCKGAQLIALDFDQSEHTPEEVAEFAETIGFTPSLWYYSYSQGTKPGNNFRVIWLLEEQIEPIQYENVYKVLLKTFEKFRPDISTKDCSRIWFGTTTPCTIVRRELVRLSEVGFLAVAQQMRARQKTAKIKKNKKNLANRYFEAVELPEAVKVSGSWWEALRGRCELFDAWASGEYLPYNARLLLFSNLKFIKPTHGKGVIADIMRFFSEETYAAHSCDEAQIRGMLNNQSLAALPIVLVGSEMKTVPEFFAQGGAATLPTDERISLAELEAMLDDQLPELLNNDETIYIQCQTASGKTHRAIEWLLSHDLTKEKFIYAMPRYSLIEEFEGRFKRMHEDKYGAPPAPRILNAIPQGTYTAADCLLMQLALRLQTPQGARRDAIMNMLDPEAKGIFVCTHHLVANLRECPSGTTAIIVDENIEGALTNETEFPLPKVRSLADFFADDNDKAALNEFIAEVENKAGHWNEKITTTPKLRAAFENSFDWAMYISYGDIMPGLARIKLPDLDARIAMRRDIPCARAVTRSLLFENAILARVPIKLLTATPKSALLSHLYRDQEMELRVYKFPLAANEGKIIQYMGVSGSRSTCQSEKTLNYIKSKLDDEKIASSFLLTYKEAIPFFKERGFKIPIDTAENQLHIQNVSGLDCLRGENLIILGKPDFDNEWYYARYYDTHPDATRPPSRVKTALEINGKLTTMYLWEDEELRRLQLEILNESLAQANGRARALREAGSIVYVFSNYPCESVDEFY